MTNYPSAYVRVTKPHKKETFIIDGARKYQNGSQTPTKIYKGERDVSPYSSVKKSRYSKLEEAKIDKERKIGFETDRDRKPSEAQEGGTKFTTPSRRNLNEEKVEKIRITDSNVKPKTLEKKIEENIPNIFKTEAKEEKKNEEETKEIQKEVNSEVKEEKTIEIEEPNLKKDVTEESKKQQIKKE